MITLTLNIRGMKPKTYTANVRMRECLDAFELAGRWDQAQGSYDANLIADAVAFVVKCFDHQFSEEELLNGYDGSPFVFIPNFCRALIGYVTESMVDFPPKAAKATKTRA